MKVGTLEVELLANMARLQADMTAAKNAVGSSMASIEKSVQLAKTALMGLAAGVIAGLTVNAFKSMVSSVIDGGEALHDLSIKTGASVESLSGLAAIGRYTDTSVDTIANTMTKLAKNMAGGTEESKGAGLALKALGLNFDSFKQMSPDEQFMAMAKSMDEFKDGAGKAAIAQALLGKEGAAMLPMMKDLAAVGELQAEVTTEQANQADNFNDNLTRLHAASDLLKKQIVMAMLPAMNGFLQAFVDVNNGTGGVKKSISDLAKDGSITEWTRTALNGASYVIDAFIIVKRTFQSVGDVVGAMVASIVVSFSSTREALGNALHGDFSAAMKSMTDGGAAQKAIWGGVAETMQETWGATTLGAAIRSRAAELKGVAGVAEGAKKSLDFVNNTEKADKAKGAVDKQATAYLNLISAIKEKIAVNEQAVLAERDLTDAEKQRLDIDKLVASGKISAAQAGSVYTQQLLAQMEASGKAKKQMDDLIKSTKENDDALIKMFDDIEKGTQAYVLESRAMKESADAFKLTEVQLRALSVAKLEDKAAGLERKAAIFDDIDWSGKMSDALRQEAQALRDVAAQKSKAQTPLQRSIIANLPSTRNLQSKDEFAAVDDMRGGLSKADLDSIAEEKLRKLGVDPSKMQLGLDAQRAQFETYYAEVGKMADQNWITEQARDQARAQLQNQLRIAQLQGTQERLGSLAAMSTSSNKRLATIGKTAAIAQATIDGILAVQKALASAPPPWNYITAAAVGVSAAANVAHIAGLKGFASGGYTGDGGRGDIAGVTHGKEFVVNATATARNRPALEAMNAGMADSTGTSGEKVIMASFVVTNNIEVKGTGTDSSADALAGAANAISRKTQSDIMESIRMGGVWSKVIKAN